MTANLGGGLPAYGQVLCLLRCFSILPRFPITSHSEELTLLHWAYEGWTSQDQERGGSYETLQKGWEEDRKTRQWQNKQLIPLSSLDIYTSPKQEAYRCCLFVHAHMSLVLTGQGLLNWLIFLAQKNNAIATHRQSLSGFPPRQAFFKWLRSDCLWAMCLLVISLWPWAAEGHSAAACPPGGLGQEHFTSTFHLSPVLGFKE